MIPTNLNDETKDMMLKLYWHEMDKWGKENHKSIAYYTYFDMWVISSPVAALDYYYQLATVELRKQKLNKIWKKIQV
jgi:hypothetical protein